MNSFNYNIDKRVFTFNFPAGTSRGVLHNKTSWFVSFSIGSKFGIGECSIIKGLSPDYVDDAQYESSLIAALESFKKEIYNRNGLIDKDLISNNSNLYKITKKSPSIRFGIEMAFLNLFYKDSVYFENNFSLNNYKIPINGLIWMGDISFMKSQIDQKIKEGFKTIKLKIGSLDFNTELSILKEIRKKYSKDEITIRVDANGSYSLDVVSLVLSELSKLDIHSIEQPIAVGQIKEMSDLCKTTPVPIALDEELILCSEFDDKVRLLEEIKPQFIILKPSLHGGIQGCNEWIQIAEKNKIKWWVTSALESNIGLNAICQYTFEFNNSLPQGLGTGSLYKDNIESSLKVKDGYIFIE